MELLINMVLLTLLAIITIGIVRVRNLFAVVVLSSAYSFLMASVMIVLDAVDVAMTEASVGAGISTVLVLGALYLTKVEEAPPRFPVTIPLIVAIGTGAMLIYGSFGLPAFGTIGQPVNTGVGAEYLAQNMHDTGIPNVVTAVLASYRGFDTLGETAVIFIAGIGVLLLLRRWRTEGPSGGPR
jgi:multicomponent Na+:H+ antiporter subunit B